MVAVIKYLPLLLSLSLIGCSTQWKTQTPPRPLTYSAPYDQLPRNVGKLRRLLVLPPVIKSIDCPDSPTDDEISVALADAVGPYLVNWKGYEIISSKRDETVDIYEMVQRLGLWQIDDIGDGSPSAKDRETLIRLANEADVDGVVVIHGDIRCLNAVDTVLYFMIVGMPNWFNKLADENLSAGIYNAVDGRLIWLSHVHVLPPTVGGGSNSSSWAFRLFYVIENAIPKVLTEE